MKRILDIVNRISFDVSAAMIEVAPVTMGNGVILTAEEGVTEEEAAAAGTEIEVTEEEAAEIAATDEVGTTDETSIPRTEAAGVSRTIRHLFSNVSSTAAPTSGPNRKLKCFDKRVRFGS